MVRALPAAVVSLTLLSGCVGDVSKSESDSGYVADVVLTGLRVQGTTDEPSVVIISRVADQDSIIDTAFLVDFQLDGKSKPNSLPPDPKPGKSDREFVLTIVAFDIAGNISTRNLTCTFEAP